ncbi:MAG: hypothetical protein LBM74_01450 [Oscillospiraceae bacterium]|jgi:hypothetical protein|nr:hypothetical protein [Oscillospiraceae bacterium]
MERREEETREVLQPQQPQPQPQPQPDDGSQARTALLVEQAQKIMQDGGPNMMDVFHQDPTIREKVLKGDWDFYVAYGYLLGRESLKERRSVPPAMRTPNSTSTRKGIAGMSEQEFAQLDERLARGEVLDPNLQ